MLGIPPAKDTDAEDVVWGLQTAEALWKRGERIDAVVWLRRAATAAGEAADDDRAFDLARSAAELSDWMATLPSGTSDAPPPPASLPSIAPAGVPTLAPDGGPPVEVNLGDVEVDRGPLPAFAMPEPERAPAPSPSPLSDDHGPSVLPGEKVHEGMYNPWDDRSSSMPDADSKVASLPPDFAEDDDEVITSVGPQLIAPATVAALIATAPVATAPVAPAASAPALSPPRPPPLPARAMKPRVPQAPTPPRVASEPPPVRMTPPPPSPVPEAHATEPPAFPEPARQPTAPAPAPALPARLDLENVEAFSDLPDDAREAFAAAAAVSILGEGEEVSSFALAYILSGTVDVAATMVDAPAARLALGAVLRSRGTIDEGVPMRLIGVSSGVVATWTDAAVKEAFRSCPWVEEDLRVAADRLQTLVGVTIGPLGERLDASIREQIIGRLTMRTLAAGEIVVTAGEAVPGLLLVGVGQLELVEGDQVKGLVGSGEFLFAGEVLGAGAAPRTARAGVGGALILQGDRMLAQELLVTCPPLLEVFAGM